MIVKMNGKRISKKRAIELLGKDRFEKRVSAAKKTHSEDPRILNSWMDGMSIEFE